MKSVPAVTVVRGDDYKLANGRPIRFTVYGAPSFASSPPFFTRPFLKIFNGTDQLIEVQGVIELTSTDPIMPQTAYFEMTAAQTEAFPAGNNRYQFRVHRFGLRVLTPIPSGDFFVVSRAGAN